MTEVVGHQSCFDRTTTVFPIAAFDAADTSRLARTRPDHWWHLAEDSKTEAANRGLGHSDHVTARARCKKEEVRWRNKVYKMFSANSANKNNKEGK